MAKPKFKMETQNFIQWHLLPFARLLGYGTGDTDCSNSWFCQESSKDSGERNQESPKIKGTIL